MNARPAQQWKRVPDVHILTCPASQLGSPDLHDRRLYTATIEKDHNIGKSLTRGTILYHELTYNDY